jgi:DNA ligase-1
VIRFAALLDRLHFAPSDAVRQALLGQYFANADAPDRGWGLALLAGALNLGRAKPATLRALAAMRSDPTLFSISHDYVGDLAETVALIWLDTPPRNAPPPTLGEIVAELQSTSAADPPACLANWLDVLDTPGRRALLHIATGHRLTDTSPRFVRTALAATTAGRIGADEIEEIWHSQSPPYAALLAWVDGRAPRPDPGDAPVFRPLMHAAPFDPADPGVARLRVEWQWDGLRVELVASDGGARLYTAEAEDISAAFPEIVAEMTFRGVLDGVLLIGHDGVPAPAETLQHRLGRRRATPALLRDHPAFVRLHDILFDGTEDVRALPFDARRARLEAFLARERPAHMDPSPLLSAPDASPLAALHARARHEPVAGLVLKRADAPYVAGAWWAWRRDPLSVDAVLMYAERDGTCTVGLWRDDGALVPVGKADGGDVAGLEEWVRAHTVARFGPVREVEKALVLAVAFDAAQRSTRHRAGVVLRGPRIVGLRPDRPAVAADRLAVLLARAD